MNSGKTCDKLKIFPKIFCKSGPRGFTKTKCIALSSDEERWQQTTCHT